MRTGFGVLLFLVALGFLCIAGTPVAADSASGIYTAQVSNNPQDIGGIDPDNPLYGFKIALENFDESFTSNQSERLEKEINHTDQRLSELQNALADNNTETINTTLDLYWQKFNQTENTIDQMEFNDTANMTAPNDTSHRWGPNDTGLKNALDILSRHQEILQNLTQEFPGNRGLAQAYNNSLEQGQMFEEKIQERNWSGQDNNNKGHDGTTDNNTFVRSDRHDARNLNLTGNGNLTVSHGDIGQSGRFGNSTFPRDTNQSWQQPRGAGNTTTHSPTNQTSQDRGKQVNPGTRGNQGQSSDHQVNGNGNSNTVNTKDTRGNSGADNNLGNGKGNGSNNGNTRQSAR
jgi:hypothetical protein